MTSLLKRVQTAEFLAIATGITLGVAYFILKLSGVSGGLALFGVSTLVVVTFLVAYSRFQVLRHVRQVPLMWRGAIFAATQILICESIRSGSVTAALNASILGSIVGIVGGRILLKETIRGKPAYGMFIAIPGAVLCLMSAPASVFAGLAGVLVGMNGTLTRAILRQENSEILPVLTVPLFYAGFIMVGFEVWRSGIGGITALTPGHLVMFTICLFMAQLMSCLILKKLDSQKTAALTLTRLPTTAGLELLLLGKSLAMPVVVGMGMIAFGAGWLFYYGGLGRGAK